MCNVHRMHQDHGLVVDGHRKTGLLWWWCCFSIVSRFFFIFSISLWTRHHGCGHCVDDENMNWMKKYLVSFENYVRSSFLRSKLGRFRLKAFACGGSIWVSSVVAVDAAVAVVVAVVLAVLHTGQYSQIVAFSLSLSLSNTIWKHIFVSVQIKRNSKRRWIENKRK